MSQSYFDAHASTWDTPEHLARAEVLTIGLRQAIPLAPSTVVADFGAGTGLMAHLLAPHVARVIALDNSANMLAVLDDKCRHAAITNIESRLFDIAHDHLEPACSDVFFTCMALHHVQDISRFATLAWHALRPGGYLAVIDLDSDDGEFHTGHTDGIYHNGFARNDLAALFGQTGFVDAASTTAFTVHKKGRSGQERDFTLFQLLTRKP